MEHNELQKIWSNMDTEINQKSKDELNLLLRSKAKQTIDRFLMIMGISLIVSAGLIVWLIITSLSRQDDLIYLINNLTLGIVSIISFSSALFSWYKLHDFKYNRPLSNYLEMRINLLSKWLTGRRSKLYIYIIPFIYLLIVLSIHVYFEHKFFIEVVSSEESIIALIVGIPVGLFVSYYSVRKIRKYQLHNLEFLKDLYARLLDLR